jgi:hypothetical protein
VHNPGRAIVLVVLGLAAGGYVGAKLSRYDVPIPEAVRKAIPEPGAAGTRVEVLNAGGREGMAQLATDQLRDRGFDVVYFGNEQPFGRETSEVVARTDDSVSARAVGRSLGIPAFRVEPDSSRYVDVTVILGTDWEPSEAAVAGESARPWWDVQRLRDRLEELARRVVEAGNG